jgi:hypothetical protein
MSVKQLEPLLLDADAAGKFIGLAARTIRKLADEGVLQKVRLGARVFFDPDDLRRFVDKAKGKKD